MEQEAPVSMQSLNESKSKCELKEGCNNLPTRVEAAAKALVGLLAIEGDKENAEG